MAQVSGARGHGAHVESTKKIGGESGAARAAPAAPVPTALTSVHERFVPTYQQKGANQSENNRTEFHRPRRMMCAGNYKNF